MAPLPAPASPGPARGPRRSSLRAASAAALVAGLLLAPLALAHDGPRDGHLVSGTPPGPWHRMLHDCADEYGHHAGNGLTQQGHGLVNLDLRERDHRGEPMLVLYLVLDRQHPLLDGDPVLVRTQETIQFSGPRGSFATTVGKVAFHRFEVLGGLQPAFLDGPQTVVDLEDLGGEDPGRYALEIGYRYRDLQVQNGEALAGFRVDGQVEFLAPGNWIPADRMVGGFYDPLFGAVLGEDPGCELGVDPHAFVAPGYTVTRSPWTP